MQGFHQKCVSEGVQERYTFTEKKFWVFYFLIFSAQIGLF